MESLEREAFTRSNEAPLHDPESKIASRYGGRQGRWIGSQFDTPGEASKLPVFLQTLVVVAGRRCSVHSLSRIKPSGNYVFLGKPKSLRAEFYLYVVPASKEPTVYVFPRGTIEADTSVPLDNEKLKSYKNNWGLLAQPVDRTNAIAWKPSILKTPKETAIEIKETIIAAEKHGLVVEHPQLPNRHQLYISKKRCQVVRAKPLVLSASRLIYVPLNLPKTDWAEFVIFFSKRDSDTAGRFFIVPRKKIVKRTLVSPTSSWLREYADAWHLLSSEG